MRLNKLYTLAFFGFSFGLVGNVSAQSGVSGGVGIPGAPGGNLLNQGDNIYDEILNPRRNQDPYNLDTFKRTFPNGVPQAERVDPNILYSPKPIDLNEMLRNSTNPGRLALTDTTRFTETQSARKKIDANELLQSGNARTFLQQQQGVDVDFGQVKIDDAVSQLLNQGIEYGDVVSLVPDQQFRQSILDQYLENADPGNLPGFDGDSYLKQVRPGTGIDGEGGSQTCRSAACGSNQITGPGTGIGGGSAGGVSGGSTVDTSQLAATTDDSGHTGPKCPEKFCGEGSNVAGCADNLCYFPPFQTLPDNDRDGRTDLVYREAGYPEVVFMMRRAEGVENLIPNCTATALANKWLITALHCLATSNKTLESRYVELDQVADGWTKLGISDESSLQAIDIVVTVKGHGKAHVEAMHINYDSVANVSFSKGGTPTRDFAIIELAGDGLNLGDFEYPYIRTNYAAQQGSISFSGFGWTNVILQQDPGFKNLPIDEQWAELKLSAFNFINDFKDDVFHDNKVLSWKNGDPDGTGGPCRYDSGGPVYAGFNRGFWNSPRQVIGVVSGLRGAAKVDAGTDCLGDGISAVAEHLAHYVGGLCEITKSAPRGCDG